MRRHTILTTSSLILILFSLIVLGRIANDETVGEYELGLQISDTAIKTPSSISNPSKRLALSAFRIEEEVPISFYIPEGMKDELSTREIENQIRDWLLLTILSNINLSEEDLNEVTFDLPTNRYRYYEHLANLEYGPTRSRIVGDDIVIALIPQTPSTSKRHDYIAHIADLQRKNLGKIPTSIIIFSYKIDQTQEKASFWLDERIEGVVPFTPEYQYTETQVSDLASLASFLDQIQDITYARKEGLNLILGGRKLKSRAYGTISLEDIASVWQSEKNLLTKLEAFEKKWDSKTYSTEFERIRLEEEMQREYKELRIVDGSGFSLDGEYDYEGLIDSLRLIFNSSETSQEDQLAFHELINSLEQKEIGPFLNLIDGLKNDIDFEAQMFGQYLYQMLQTNKFQKARYDGDLQGTRVGMILFYCDLMAKIWTFDFQKSTPFDVLSDFATHPTTEVAMVYKAESEKYPSCRLWFGPNQNGYQLSQNSEVFFSRNATRIYSASSNPLRPGEEVQATFALGSPIEWWNNHFEEIAAHEPLYESQNEIMKWSVLISCLNEMGSDNLSFLSSKEVYREYWFPNWAKNNPSLKFKKWKEINFYPRGYKGTTTEALPNLVSPFFSRFGEDAQILGGVSLASKNMIKAAPKLNPSIPGKLQRSNLKSILNTQEGRIINAVDGRIYKIPKYFKSRLNIITKEGLSLRNKFSQITSNKTFIRTINKNPNSTVFKSRADDIALGDLSIQRVSGANKNSFSIAFEGRAIDNGNQVARGLSNAKNPQKYLEGMKGRWVEEYVSLGNRQYLIKTPGGKKWMQVEISNNPAVDLPGGWHARTSGFGKNSKIIRQKWVDESIARNLAGRNNAVFPRPPNKNPAPEIIQRISKNGDTRSVARELLGGKSNPRLTIKEIKNFQIKELRHIDEMMNNPAQYEACVENLDFLIRIGGEQPHLLFRRAILDIGRGGSHNLNKGISKLNQISSRNLKANTKFLDEVNGLLKKNPKISKMDKKVIDDFIEFKQGRKNWISAQLDEFPVMEKVPPKSLLNKIDKGNVKVVVQDHPGLNSLDWNVSTRQALNQAMETYPGRIEVLKLDKVSITDFRFELGSNGIRSISKNPSRDLINTFLRTHPIGKIGYQNNLSNCGDEDNPCPEIYIVKVIPEDDVSSPLTK